MRALRNERACLALAVILSGLVLGADDPPPPNPTDEVLAVAEVVLAEHISPPTRQEMVLGALRFSYEGSGPWGSSRLKPPPDLSRQVSNSATVEDLRQLLQTCSDAITSSVSAHAPVSIAFREGLSLAVPGGVVIGPAEEMRVEEQVRSNGYVGIGVALNGNPPSFWSVFPNGPAAKAGIREKDRIVEINGRPADGSLAMLVQELRGEAGTDLTLVVQTDEDEPRTVTITRTVVGMEGDPEYRLISTAGLPDVAHIKLGRISSSTVHELEKLRIDLEEVAGLILDLRETSPGTVHQTVLLADAFLDGGAIGNVKSRTGSQTYSAEPGELFPGLKLGLIVGPETSETVEWLAAALQDNRRALLFGERTPGQAYVQTAVPIPGTGNVVQMRTGILERPGGRRLLRFSTDSDQIRNPVRVRAVRRTPTPPAASAPNPNRESFTGDVGSTEVPWGVKPDGEETADEAMARRLLGRRATQPADTPADRILRKLGLPPPATEGADANE